MLYGAINFCIQLLAIVCLIALIVLVVVLAAIGIYAALGMAQCRNTDKLFRKLRRFFRSKREGP